MRVYLKKKLSENAPAIVWYFEENCPLLIGVGGFEVCVHSVVSGQVASKTGAVA